MNALYALRNKIAGHFVSYDIFCGETHILPNGYIEEAKQSKLRMNCSVALHRLFKRSMRPETFVSSNLYLQEVFGKVKTMNELKSPWALSEVNAINKT